MIKSKKQSLIVIGAFILVLLLGTTMTSFYLVTGTNYLTMTPLNYESQRLKIYELSNSGYLLSGDVTSRFALRPVISIKNGQLVTKGDGTVNNPYIIE